MARFYIATTVSNWKNHNTVRDFLISQGHTITYDWTVNTNAGDLRGRPVPFIQEVAEGEANGIRDADFVVALLPGGFGTHAEIGMAFITKTPTFIHAFDPRFFSNHAETGKTRNFYWSKQTTHSVTEDIEQVGIAIIEWWDEALKKTYLGHTIPLALQHLNSTEPCGSCPIGGRYNFDEDGDQGSICPRAALCDWECQVQVEVMSQPDFDQ
ncbi:hypothetical protein N9917_01540 [Deltaproteobacteria bacterium]|nr:hypothetical protein [Deltaproteobacteria bacterium]